MTEPSSAEAEAPIDPIGDSRTPDENTDAPGVVVPENDRLEDFPAQVVQWPDHPPTFEDEAFPPPDEGVS
jgi:hypothetical protein